MVMLLWFDVSAMLINLMYVKVTYFHCDRYDDG